MATGHYKRTPQMYDSRRGRTPWNKGKKGVQKSWNKGRKGIYSQETLRKWSETRSGRNLSEETKRKIGESHKGERHYLWIHDRTKLAKSDEQRFSSAHREWSKQVKNRDYWKCQISNDDCSGRVEAHHILAWRDHPELRYEIKNGITLCHFHHPRKRVDEERYADQFQKLVAAKMQ